MGLLVASPATQLYAQAGQPQPDAPPETVNERRPYRGLFGVPFDATRRQALDFTFSAFGAYDQDVFATEQGPSSEPGRRLGGWFSGLGAGLSYTRPGRRVTFNSSGGVGVNRYFRNSRTASLGKLSADLNWLAARYTRVVLSGSVVYSPEYRVGLFSSGQDLALPEDPYASVHSDIDLYSESALRTASSIAISQDLGRRTNATASYSISSVDYLHQPYDNHSWSAGAGVTHALSRSLSARAGYTYSTANYRQFGDLQLYEAHNIDVGLDYSRALSVSRRTRVTFSTGSAVLVNNPTLLAPTPLTEDGRASAGVPVREVTYHLIGSATLVREIQRTWRFEAGYRRAVDFHEGFLQPFLADSVSVQGGGLLSRRVRFSGSASYSFGKVGTYTRDDYNAASATAGLQYAISRMLTTYGRYVYYRYDFKTQVALDPRFAPFLDRQGVRFGLSMTLPVIR